MEACDEPALGPMTREEFRRWAMDQGRRYELVNGSPIAMAPERLGHARLKARVWRAFDQAIAERGLPCEALPDGVTVVVDEVTQYEPDTVVHCGPRDPDDDLAVSNPVIVVEILSPRTQGIDTGTKLIDYFRVPSICHYVILRTDRKAVIHHRRIGDNDVQTHIHQSGTIEFDPPGLALDVDALYPR